SLNLTHTDIDESTGVDLPSALVEKKIGIGTKFPVPFVDSDRYFMGVDVFPSINTDDYDGSSSAFRIPFRTYLIYKESDDFLVVAGVWIRPGYKDEVLPLLGFNYKANDRLSFNIASDDPNITYKLNEKTSALLEFDYKNEEYEATEAANEGKVIRNKYYTMGVGLKHQFCENFSASASVGGAFNRKIEFVDDSGKIVPENGIYASLSMNARF
ncbi:MAG: DUF6268 family outer membrane beta-barrel protein, partial [Candidatus Omnitrophota bacterium]|nr:DUF6268 family outer membrane beta-barrel protein [Candidatus Omnitrophota bacterium]